LRLRRQLPVYSPITARAVRRVFRQALRSTNEVEARLTARLAREYDADHVYLFGSGTQALQVAVRVAWQRVGESRVALPSFTCFDVGAAAVAVGARILLYDIDPHTLQPDLDSLSRWVREGARVVVVTPLYGYPVNWQAIDDVVTSLGAVAIEDAAQGHGARWRNRPLGSMGAISVLSFGRGKGWTGGAGGALLLRGNGSARGLESQSVESARKSEELRALTFLTAQWVLGRPQVYGLPAAIPWLALGETVYRDARPPRPITHCAATCLDAAFAAAIQEADARRANAAALLASLHDRSRVQTIQTVPEASPGFLRLPLRLCRGLSGFRDPTRAVALGVAPSYPSVLGDVPQVRARLEAGGHHAPGGEALSRTLFTAPTHSLLSGREREELVQLLLEYRT